MAGLTPVSFKHRVEYVAFRVLAGILRILPMRCSLFLGWGGAWIAHFIARWRVPEARCRIHEVFGDSIQPAQVRRIAWQAWRNFCFSIIELVRTPSMTGNDPLCQHEDIHRLKDVLLSHCHDGKGLIFTLPHAGNWDLACISLRLLNVPIISVGRQQKNPLVDAYLNRMRSCTGMKMYLRGKHPMTGVIRDLRQGKVLAIMPDVRSNRPGVVVNYLGGRANLSGGLLVFARHSDAPILPVVMLRKGWSGHQFIAGKAVVCDPSADRHQDHHRMMQEIMAQFETIIRQHPEQYFWFNKRWVLDPLESVCLPGS